MSDVDLSAFDSLPAQKDLPDTAKADPQVQAYYKEIEIFRMIDDKFGNGNKKLQADEITKFFKANPNKDPDANACQVLKEARMFATAVPDLVNDLKKAPDMSPVDLAPYYSLPDLKKFVDLKDTQDPEELKKLIQDSTISPDLKKLLLTSEDVLARYFNAKGYVKADLNGDGKLSADDINLLIKANNLPTDDPSLSPAVILADARQNAPKSALFGFGLRKQLNLKNDVNQIDLVWIVSVAQVAPSFLESDPRLKTLLQAIAKKNDKGEYELLPSAQDLVLTKDELLSSPALQEYKKGNSLYTTDEAFFASLKSLEENMEQPSFLWPKDLRDKLKNAGDQVMTQITQMQMVNDDQRRAELILGFLDKVDDGKFEQEKMDHAGSEGTFLSDVTYVISFGQWSWNKHFQEERPKSHKAERDDAIEALRTTMRERNLSKVEDAVSYMDANNQHDKVVVLRDYCDIDRWIRIGNTEDEVTRAKALQAAANDYRVGEYKFWEFPIIPLPRLGDGGFFNRASHISNWTWKSPELPVTLSIDNFLATKTPNNWDLTHKPGSAYLLQQLSENDRKTFLDAADKAQKGETVDSGAIDTLLSKAALTQAGQDTLKAQLKSAITAGENTKVVNDFKQTSFVQGLMKDQEKNKEKLSKIDGLFGAVAGGIATADKLGGEISQLYLEEEDAKTLKEYLGKVKPNMPPQEALGIDALYREAQFGDKEARVRELFAKAIQTPEDKKEFNDLVKGSKLSTDNQLILSVAFDKQPMTITVADPAEKEFLSILGFPKINPMTGNYDPKSVGNLHNAFRTTVDRGVGAAMFMGPMIAGGGVGYSLANVGKTGAFWKAGLGGVVGGGFIGYALSDGESTGTRVAYTAIGAGVGFGVCYGAARLFGAKAINPMYAAIGGSMLGSLIYISPGGQKWASQSWEVMQMPYRDWSDLSMMNAPAEGIGLYMDFYAGSKAMEGVLGGAKMVGAMELGDKLAKLLRVTPGVVKTGTGAVLGSTMGYLTSDKKEGNQVRNTIIGGILGTTLSLKAKWPFGAALGGTIGYAGSDHKDWKTDVRRSLTGAFIGGTAFYWGGRLFKNVNFKGYTAAEAEASGPWVKEQVSMLETQVAKERASLEMGIDKNKLSTLKPELRQNLDTMGMGKADSSAFNFSEEVIGQKVASIQRLEELAKAYKTLGEANNALSLQILTNAQKNLSQAETLLMGRVPEGLGAAEMKALNSGQITIEALGEAKLAQSQMMLLSGANEVSITNRMLVSNGRLSRLLLMGVFANKVDDRVKPKPPLIPPFSEDFQGNPRPKPAQPDANQQQPPQK
jgi:hypothetical protein